MHRDGLIVYRVTAGAYVRRGNAKATVALWSEKLFNEARPYPVRRKSSGPLTERYPIHRYHRFNAQRYAELLEM